MVTALLVITLAVVLPLAALRYRPDQTMRVFKVIFTARQTIGGLFILLVAFAFILSGSPTMMLLGALGIAYGVLVLVIKEPHEEIVSWVR
jgi:hypothetical protein